MKLNNKEQYFLVGESTLIWIFNVLGESDDNVGPVDASFRPQDSKICVIDGFPWEKS